MVAVSLSIEAYASLRLSFVHEIGLKNDGERHSVSARMYALQIAINCANHYSGMGVAKKARRSSTVHESLGFAETLSLCPMRVCARP